MEGGERRRGTLRKIEGGRGGGKWREMDVEGLKEKAELGGGGKVIVAMGRGGGTCSHHNNCTRV